MKTESSCNLLATELVAWPRGSETPAAAAWAEMAAAPWTEAVERAWQPRAQSGHWLRGRWMYLESQPGSEPDIYTTKRSGQR